MRQGNLLNKLMEYFGMENVNIKKENMKSPPHYFDCQTQAIKESVWELN